MSTRGAGYTPSSQCFAGSLFVRDSRRSRNALPRTSARVASTRWRNPFDSNSGQLASLIEAGLAREYWSPDSPAAAAPKPNAKSSPVLTCRLRDNVRLMKLTRIVGHQHNHSLNSRILRASSAPDAPGMMTPMDCASGDGNSNTREASNAPATKTIPRKTGQIPLRHANDAAITHVSGTPKPNKIKSAIGTAFEFSMALLIAPDKTTVAARRPI
jgi:hypothetical protein